MNDANPIMPVFIAAFGRLRYSVCLVVWLGVFLAFTFLDVPKVEANPTGGQVVEGSVQITHTSNPIEPSLTGRDFRFRRMNIPISSNLPARPLP
jgi:hypothetical protein